MIQAGRSRPLAALAALALVLAACGPDAPASGLARPSSRVTVEPTASPPAAIPPAPTPSATPAEQFASDRLVGRIRADGLWGHLVALQDITDTHGGHRASGSAGFEASMAYVERTLAATGLTAERQPFIIDGSTGTNLVAEWSGAGREVVILGAHLDTVIASPGVNDNGSGVAAVLAVAEALVALPRPERSIRLAFWDAEEHGPLGSRAYVEGLDADELGRIVAYLNLDMIASPNALRLVYAEADASQGSARITQLFAAYFDGSGLAWEPVDLDGDSDHGPFIAAGVATGGLFSGGIEPVTDAQADRFGATPGVPADACSHRPCDTLDNVEVASLVELTGAAAHVLATIAGGEPS